MVGLDGSTPAPFHLGQAWTMDSARRITAMLAGSQGGKTGLGPWWLWQEIQRSGAGDYFAVTASYDLFKLKMLPALLQVFVDILGVGRYWGGDRILELRVNKSVPFQARHSTDAMWGRIILRSADSPGGMESGTAKAAWLDEAGQDRFTLMAYRAIQRRLSLNVGRILITTTLYNLGWVKSEIIDRAADSGATTLQELTGGAEIERTDSPAADICLVQFDSIVNPAFPLDEYHRQKATMPDDEFAMFYRGRVAKLRTLIYDCFDRVTHIVKAFTPPQDWPRVVGIDPIGARVAALGLAYDADKNQLHVFREYSREFGETTEGHVLNIRELFKNDRVIAWVGGGPSERQARVDWNNAGIPVIEPPITDVWSQIGRVYSLMKTYALVVHETCPFLISELGSYQRKRDQQGNLTDDIKDKEIYHLSDCLRYACAWITEPGGTGELIYAPVQIGPAY